MQINHIVVSLSYSKRLIIRDWTLNEKNTSPNRPALTFAFKHGDTLVRGEGTADQPPSEWISIA